MFLQSSFSQTPEVLQSDKRFPATEKLHAVGVDPSWVVSLMLYPLNYREVKRLFKHSIIINVLNFR